MIIDFHTHSHASDGALSPQALLRRALEAGVQQFALTDHDTLSGIEPIFRLKEKYESVKKNKPKTYIPGVEFSLKEEVSGLTVHLIGLFPHIHEQNYRSELRKIDTKLGDFCRYRCSHRGTKDMDERIKTAFRINLDGIAGRYGTPGTVIKILRDKAERINASYFQACHKERDIIQYPIPITYQIILDTWEELIPSSSTEKAMLYVMRSDQGKMDRLSKLYMADGLNEAEAIVLTKKNQGILLPRTPPQVMEMGIGAGLDLLHEARAVTILAHPAVDHYHVGFDDFDRYVTFPLIDRGLQGIEVFYPYDLEYQQDALHHYGKIASQHGLLVSGGTDYHGDTRVGLDDIRLDAKEAQAILSS